MNKANSRDKTYTGIILKKIPFRETSFILDILIKELGIVSVIAKGIRKENSQSQGIIDLLNELDLELYKNPNSEWFILKKADFIKSHLYQMDFQTTILMQSAVEIYRQLIIDQTEASLLYTLLIRYLTYLESKPTNAIAIFWRFLLRLFKIFGIEFQLKHCVICNQEKLFFAYYPIKHGFICKDCYRIAMREQVIELSENVPEILNKLENIGNYLKTISISESSQKQLNKIFLLHLSEHFHKKFFLKSLKMLYL